MRKSIAYSQNFLKDDNLVADLVGRSSISQKDPVYEIGAGTGIITTELLKRSNRVVAFEIDQNLFSKLSKRFEGNSSLTLRNTDFLKFKISDRNYKVFSNIPFNITADVIKNLAQSPNPPEDAYLITQEEAAKKFAGEPFDTKNSQVAILLKPWFSFELFHKFKKDDFFPRPNVEIVMIKISRKENPLIKAGLKEDWQDFVTYTFNQFQPNVVEGLTKVFGKQKIRELSKRLGFSPKVKPSELEIKDWVELFSDFQELQPQYQNIVKGSYSKLISQQKVLEKIHRSRTDKNWRKYRT